MSSDQATEIEAVKRQFNSRKGQVTQKKGSLQKTLDKTLALDTWSQFSEDQIVQKAKDLEGQLKQLEQLAIILEGHLAPLKADETATPPFDPGREIKDIWDQYNKYAGECDEVTDKAMDVLDSLRKAVQARPTQTPDTGGAGGGGRTNKYKDNHSMKPKELTLKNTVSWLAEWKEQMKAYVSSSNMETFEPQIAQQYILSCVDEDLKKKLRPRINDRVPIYSSSRHVKGLVDLIEDEFLREYPLITRRLEVFEIRQQRNEQFDEYYARLNRSLEEAVYEDITPEKLKAILLLIGLKDKRLREQMMLKKTDNVDELRDIGLAFQAIDKTNKKLSSASANNINPGWRRGGGRGNGQNGGNQKSGGGKGNENKGSGRTEYKGPRVKDGKCTACGKNGGCQNLKGGCKASGHKCRCGKTGHFDNYCFNKKSWSKGANATDIENGQDRASAGAQGNGEDDE